MFCFGKATAYKAIVRPILEYSSPVWCLHSAKDESQLVLIQHCAAHWACGSRWSPANCNWTKSSDFCVQELNLSPLQTWRSYFAISFLHDILHYRVAILFSQHFQFSTTTRSHPMTLCILSSTITPRQYSFLVNTPFLWNTILLSILQLWNAIAFWFALRHFLFV